MTNTTMSINIERTPRTLELPSGAIEVIELGVQLPFARKPADLNEVGGYGQQKVFIIETREMSPTEFDGFAATLYKSRDWLKGKGGGAYGGYLCVEISAPGRPYLYINPEGSDYARYVARLG